MCKKCSRSLCDTLSLLFSGPLLYYQLCKRYLFSKSWADGQLELRGGTGDAMIVLRSLDLSTSKQPVFIISRMSSCWMDVTCSRLGLAHWFCRLAGPALHPLSFFSFLDQEASQDVFLWLRWMWEGQVETCRVSFKA